MKIEVRDGIVSVREVKELDGGQSLFQKVRGRLPRRLQAIEIDLSQTEVLNSSGLGELIALQKMALRRSGKIAVRLLNPPAPVQQLFELTRLQKVFEILKR